MANQESEIKIGRAKDNHVVITNKSVSRYHAVVYADEDEYYLKDLGSTYGTFLMKGKEKVKVSDNHVSLDDLIYLGTNGPFVVGEIVRESKIFLLPNEFNQWKAKSLTNNYANQAHLGNLVASISAAADNVAKNMKTMTKTTMGNENSNSGIQSFGAAQKKRRCKHCASVIMVSDASCPHCGGFQ